MNASTVSVWAGESVPAIMCASRRLRSTYASVNSLEALLQAKDSMLLQTDSKDSPGRSCHNMGRIKRKSAFEHAQNAQIHIILHMRKVSSGHLLSIEIFCSIKWLSLRTAKAQSRLRGSGPLLSAYAQRHVFSARLFMLRLIYIEKRRPKLEVGGVITSMFFAYGVGYCFGTCHIFVIFHKW